MKQFAFLQPLPTVCHEQLLPELNKCSLARELLCPEFLFEVEMNPWQHPIIGKNIHLLSVLCTSLSNGCGGLIYLISDLQVGITRDVIDRFQLRMAELMVKRTGLRKAINFMPAPLHSYPSAWTAMHVKRSDKAVLYAPLESHLNPFTFCTDIHGRVYIEEAEGLKHHDEINATQHVAVQKTSDAEQLSADSSETASNVAGAAGGPAGSDDKTRMEAQTRTVDFSSYTKLDWTKHKKRWEKYIKVNPPTVEKIIESCPMWKPTDPMTITPNKETLKCWFDCDEDMEATLATVDMKEPGFALVCKTWRFHASNAETDSRPPGHLCDILTVTTRGRVCFWAICGNRDERSLRSQMKYLMSTGRMIKYQLTNKGQSEMSNLCIECRLFFPNSGTLSSAVRSTMNESLQMQTDILGFYDEAISIKSLQRAIALVILSKQSPLKSRADDQTTVTLSAQQAELLFPNYRVNYVTGPAGSGKSYSAVFIYKQYGKDSSVYICTTEEFVKYLHFCGYEGMLIQGDQDLFSKIQGGAFYNKTCVIIDDSHNFSCSKRSMKKLFKLMKNNRQISLFVFADNEYQSFDRKRKQDMSKCIRDLSVEVLGEEPHYTSLTAIYRNTQKVVSFIQSAIQDSHEDHRKLECRNINSGDGIECIRMPNMWVNNAENDLVTYIRSICMSEAYSVREIAVLLDPSYTTDQPEKCRELFKDHMPNSCVQSASVFPRTGVIVDRVESFLGLDTHLCVFILSHTAKKNMSYFRKLFQKRHSGPDTHTQSTLQDIYGVKSNS